MRLLLATTAGAVTTGCAAALGPLAALGGLAAALALLLSGAPRGGRRWTALALLLGLGWGAFITRPAPPLPTGEVTVTGTVFAVSCDRPPRCRVTLADAQIGPELRLRRVAVWFDDLYEPPATGLGVRLLAEVREARRATNPSPFTDTVAPPRPYLKAIADLELSGASPSWDAAIAATLRERMDFADPRAAALYRALLLGDKGDLEAQIRWGFQDTGTAHILAISGLHLALIGFGLRALLLAALLRVRRLAQGARVPAIAAAAALPLLWAYTEVVAPSDATRRALVFIGLVFLGEVLARRAQGRRTLLLAAITGLLADPTALLRPGFQLSFAAAASLVLGAPLGRRIVAFWSEPGRLRRPLVRRLAIGVSALLLVDALTFAATAPLTAAWFGQVAPHGLWINLVAVPLVTLVVLPIGALWAALALLAPPLAAWLAAAPSAIGGSFVAGILGAADAVGPSSVAAWPVPLAVAATVAFLALLATPRGRGLAATALAGIAVLGAWVAHPGPGPLEVTALDVGHGDALLLRLPAGGAALVDAGGAWQGGEADRRQADRQVVASLLQRGVAALDALIVTHADRDHIGGAATVVARIPVRSLWLPPCALLTGRGQALARAVLDRGGTVRPLHRQPATGWEGAELEVLWPPGDQVGWDGRCRVAANDSSLVLALRYAGRTLLLTGDIEAPDEARLVAEAGARLRADVLKAPHHGSRTSSTPALLAAVRPRDVVVSGLPGRAPMPPHDDVLARYRARGTRVWITGRDGAVTVRVGPDGRLTVSALRSEGGDDRVEAWARFTATQQGDR
ncbi:MAG: DNA internalization-related competence protein ComEC/Rec2 [Deltaproteobacteria bacterium HGW-Deltaproteobacteria-14]|jgi:competence protein ComEC|nr:MAG: DNA internalization-related competence protein ComEC/Rec2 [Deltaproteobacteria bacterium HGW-Deltaproteobacteria-14]